MKNSPGRGGFPLYLGYLTMMSVAVLLVWDFLPNRFPARAHDVLGALPLTLIAITYLAHQAGLRPGPAEFLKAVLLAGAFLLWAANQFWPDARGATLFNDLAIALFVLDVFLVVAGWPSSPDGELFASVVPGDRK